MKRGRGAEWLGAAVGYRDLPAQHLGHIKHITPAKHFPDGRCFASSFSECFQALAPNRKSTWTSRRKCHQILSTQPSVSSLLRYG